MTTPSYGTNFRRAEEASNLTGPIRAGDDASASAIMTPFGQAPSGAKTRTDYPTNTQFVPTVTLGGAPAGYVPDIPQPTVTLGGAPAGYKTPSEIAGGPTTTNVSESLGL